MTTPAEIAAYTSGVLRARAAYYDGDGPRGCLTLHSQEGADHCRGGVSSPSRDFASPDRTEK